MILWHLIARLGEAQILLPLMLLLSQWCARDRAARPGVVAWLLGTAAAALLVTATKVAFIGFGWGVPAWDFTGLSGHAMFAAAVLPVLGALVVGRKAPVLAARSGAVVGLLLAFVVALSRVVIGAHSVSEVVLGSVVGLAAAVGACLAFDRHGCQGRFGLGLTPWAGALVLVWLVATSLSAPPSRTHDWVTRLSLVVSGRTLPYTRGHWRHRATVARLSPMPLCTSSPSSSGFGGRSDAGSACTGTSA